MFMFTFGPCWIQTAMLSGPTHGVKLFVEHTMKSIKLCDTTHARANIVFFYLSLKQVNSMKFNSTDMPVGCSPQSLVVEQTECCFSLALHFPWRQWKNTGQSWAVIHDWPSQVTQKPSSSHLWKPWQSASWVQANLHSPVNGSGKISWSAFVMQVAGSCGAFYVNGVTLINGAKKVLYVTE